MPGSRVIHAAVAYGLCIVIVAPLLRETLPVRRGSQKPLDGQSLKEIARCARGLHMRMASIPGSHIPIAVYCAISPSRDAQGGA